MLLNAWTISSNVTSLATQMTVFMIKGTDRGFIIELFTTLLVIIVISTNEASSAPWIFRVVHNKLFGGLQGMFGYGRSHGLDLLKLKPMIHVFHFSAFRQVEERGMYGLTLDYDLSTRIRKHGQDPLQHENYRGFFSIPSNVYYHCYRLTLLIGMDICCMRLASAKGVHFRCRKLWI
jgi:hypothetical protein